MLAAAFLLVSVAVSAADGGACSARIERCHCGPAKVLQTEAVVSGMRLAIADDARVERSRTGETGEVDLDSLVKSCGKGLAWAATPYFAIQWLGSLV